jgi:hypothetical protein
VLTSSGFWQVEVTSGEGESSFGSLASSMAEERATESPAQLGGQELLKMKRLIGKMNYSERFAQWHKDYDEIDWEAELSRSPILQAALSGQPRASTNYAPSLTGTYNNSPITINIIVGQKPDSGGQEADPKAEPKAKPEADATDKNKENCVPN